MLIWDGFGGGVMGAGQRSVYGFGLPDQNVPGSSPMSTLLSQFIVPTSLTACTFAYEWQDVLVTRVFDAHCNIPGPGVLPPNYSLITRLSWMSRCLLNDLVVISDTSVC